MTTKTPPAPAAGKTGTLPLKGAKDGITKGLDNKTTIKAPVPKELKAAAMLYAEALDRVDYHKIDSDDKGAKLVDEFLKLGKDMPKKVRVDTDKKAHFFYPQDLFKLKHEAKAPTTAVEA